MSLVCANCTEEIAITRGRLDAPLFAVGFLVGGINTLRRLNGNRQTIPVKLPFRIVPGRLLHTGRVDGGIALSLSNRFFK